MNRGRGPRAKTLLFLLAPGITCRIHSLLGNGYFSLFEQEYNSSLEYSEHTPFFYFIYLFVYLFPSYLA